MIQKYLDYINQHGLILTYTVSHIVNPKSFLENPANPFLYNFNYDEELLRLTNADGKLLVEGSKDAILKYLSHQIN